MQYTYALAGTNTVTLTVSGPLGTNTSQRADYIIVTNCPPQLGVEPEALDFGSLLVGQASTQRFSIINTGCQALTGTATLVSVGTPFTLISATYDVAPSATGQIAVAFTPTSAGSFTGTVVFTSNGGSSTNPVLGTGISGSLVASFTAAPLTGKAPLTVTFTDRSVGNITNRFWSFDHVITRTTTATNFTHTFSNAGMYTIGLTVSGPGGRGGSRNLFRDVP